ncbi:DNA-binding response regulator, partial [Methylophaga nitratireducenticrescens]
MYVLIVEDDALMGEGIQTGLTALGIQAEWVM